MRAESRISNEQYANALRAVLAQMLAERGDGHIGGSLSMSDVAAVLFNHYLHEDPKDWFVLSKGHAGPCYYSALILEHKLPFESIETLNANGTLLPSHPDRNLTPGVDCSTGSLGQGISQAAGLAYAAKMKNTGGWVYCIIGDGELNEGETYEALEFAANKHLNNLIVFVDNNKKQVDGLTKDVSCRYDFEKLFESLDMVPITVDGHDTNLIDRTIYAIENNPTDSCHVIILDTVKGKGIPYFEKQENCHHVTFSEEELQILRQFAERNSGDIHAVMENSI